MNAYFLTAFVNHGGPLLLTPWWIAEAVSAWRRGRPAAALLLGTACAGMTVWSVSGFLPLLQGLDPTGMEVPLSQAAAVPWLVVAALALIGEGADRSRRLDLGALALLALVPFGVTGWMAALLLVARHWMAPGSHRRLLLGGLLAVGLASAVDGRRLQAVGSLENLAGTDRDTTIQLVDATITVLEVGGAAVMAHRLLRPGASPDP